MNETCAICNVPRYMHMWVTQPGKPWHQYKAKEEDKESEES